MSYPAWFDLHDDDVIVRYPTTLRVYALLLRDPDILWKPVEVKASGLADKLGASRDSVNAALDLLVDRGYAVMHGRGYNKMRRLILTRVRVLPPN